MTDLHALMSRMTGDEKHSAAATSTLDVLWVLYDRVMDHDRDRFYLSKGHGPMAYYAVLAAKGHIPEGWLDDWATFDSPLGMHPDRVLVPGVHVSSGSLGHGLALAVGAHLAHDARGHTGSIYALVGDAELDEGSNHEAIAVAGRLGLERLSVVVIDNDSASHGWPGGIEARFAGEGWATAVVDGRDHDAIEAALLERVPGRPHVTVAHVERRDG